MLYTDYQTTFTTAFVEFRETLTESRMAFIDFEISKEEEYFQDFVLQTIKLRRIYEKVFESDMHTDFLQPKVETIYDLIQDNVEAVRNFEPKVTNKISRLQEEMHYYLKQFEALIQK
jgi:translation elongation factor EF-G